MGDEERILLPPPLPLSIEWDKHVIIRQGFL
jgi:hypothetical protein